MFRRLVARTMAKQLGQVVMRRRLPINMFSPPEQDAHSLQVLTEMDFRAIVTLIDGVNAFDLMEP